MLQQKQSYRQQLGRVNFESMLESCVGKEDREVVNEAYRLYMTSICDMSTEKDTQNVSEAEESVASLVLEEDGGARVEPLEM